MKVISGSSKRHYLARAAISLIIAALIAGMSGCYDDHPLPPCPAENLEIRTWYDLDAVRDNRCGNHTLMNDLNSSTLGYDELAGPMANDGRGWEPICSEGVDEISFPFKGTFDGQGCEIHDLFINGTYSPPWLELGLFGMSAGIIKDIGIVNATVIGVDHEQVGALVGLNNFGIVSNSYSTGNVSGYWDVGGLVGSNGYGTVSDSYSAASVTGNWNVGGLVGENKGNVNNDGTVSNSYSTGTVTGNSSVGGLVGENTGTVSDSFWDIQTSGQSTSDGGMGKTTAAMQNIATFSGVTWDIIAVANPDIRNISYTWNIVNDVTYPFLSWQT